MDEQLNQLASAFYSLISRNAGYLARQEIENLVSPLRSNPKRLEPFGYKVYSQNDEDGILHEIFKRLKIGKGFFCEIGVENGLECNSLYLIHQGWRGSWIEGNEAQRDPIFNKFESLINSNRLFVDIGYVYPDNINACIKGTLTPLGMTGDNLDFLSIDIDGNDIYLLEALSYNPKVICIEYNAKFPPPVSKKPVPDPNNSWRGGDYMGSSLVALDEMAKNKNYTLVATNITGSNAFFVRNDLVGDAFDKISTPENLYNPPRYWLTFDHYRNIGHPADFGPYTDLVD
ncbi:hypothetical protein Q9Q94_13725 [Uliginosibacterium sp. 31-16]|uniref:hypothetical protein n=1 Tax=Uliginosibacterium sp. 31-16 TaxID=3068315 RepID=UPI00273E91AD|nr:hypothetical protein [Uliginosibacterium sp. 31-16]MDP5240599.1 hypothetical protein [Uliginosibacterium sp. 31-16]